MTQSPPSTPNVATTWDTTAGTIAPAPLAGSATNYPSVVPTAALRAKAQNLPNSSSGSTLLGGNAGWGNVEIEADVKVVTTGESGIVFRSMDNQNYYRFTLSPTQAKLIKVVNGQIPASGAR